ncbi:class I SAM-dependent methyltransferase [Neorhizobium sp. NCHU2750]|uniref:class I SAM-dependent methyltransferase n=1 Tax=Neorhizobium sp. NCHU2750 TaxID=1825976 RepID=UPI000E72FA14|nr:type 11 methyltransferase [Neorhizobium sp. NCHU2750]
MSLPASNEHIGRFSTGAQSYDRFRPRYPKALVEALAVPIGEVSSRMSDARLFDVGSGSGIFSRQLRAFLPATIAITGIEPSADMRETAIGQADGPGLDFVDGRAEILPAADGEIVAVTAATAAHWFDREVFYREAQRVLVPGGVLAIVEYVRDVEGSPAARAVMDFLNTEGEARKGGRPDYLAELSALDGFTGAARISEASILPLSSEDFVGLALSSSYAKPAVERMGRSGAEVALRDIGRLLADTDGNIPFGYLFQAFMVRRKG